MDQNLIQIAVLAFVAAFILFRLYATLGRRTGAERPEEPRPQPAQGPSSRVEPEAAAVPAGFGGGKAGEGLVDIVRADPRFEVDHFLTGARGAYEMIVGAFAKGDREALVPLLTPRVLEAYEKAIAERNERGEPGPELVRLRNSEIADAAMDGGIARVTVKFEAELASGAHGVRDAREKWTFERDVRSDDPNWRLARVTAA